MTQKKKVVGRGVEEIAVRTRRRNGLDRFECLRVEKGRGIAGDQTRMVFRVDRDAMPGRISQRARELVRIEVEYANLGTRCSMEGSLGGRALK